MCRAAALVFDEAMGLRVSRGTEEAERAGRSVRSGPGAWFPAPPARLTALSLVAVVALVLGGAGSGNADAVSACTGRPGKVVKFAAGELRVYKSRSYACALAVARKPGPRRRMSVQIQPRGGSPVVDSGRYTRQAGPVTVHALNRCVRASATLSGKSVSTGWILC